MNKWEKELSYEEYLKIKWNLVGIYFGTPFIIMPITNYAYFKKGTLKTVCVYGNHKYIQLGRLWFIFETDYFNKSTKPIEIRLG